MYLHNHIIGKMTSSIKLEVHNISQCSKQRNMPRSQATCTENLVF